MKLSFAVGNLPRSAVTVGLRRCDERLPVGRAVVLQELSPYVPAGIEAGNNRVEDAGGAVEDVEGRMKALLDDLPRGDRGRVFVSDPAGVDAIHVDAVVEI